MLDGLQAHVCLVDETGAILMVNRAWRAFAQVNGGDPSATAVGVNYLHVCNAAVGDGAPDASAFLKGLRQVLRGERGHFEMEYPCHSPSQLGWFLASACLLQAPGPRRVVVAHQPMTERRLAEARSLEAQKLLAMGTMASGLAHDFNNVLGAILSNAAMALGGLGPEHPARPALERVRQAGLRARALVRRVLSFARGEPSRPWPQALLPLLEDGLTMARLTVPAHGQLHVELGGHGLWACVDATDLQQAVLNLVNNAWHALEGRSGHVSVGLERLPSWHAQARDALGTAHLWVSDGGCGMSPAVRTRIFEPFFTTRPAGVGTGLGLVQVQAAVERAAGRLDVESEPGRGSTFHLYLPLCAAAEPPAAAPAGWPADVVQALPTTSERPAFAAQPPASPYRALLVDDDEVVMLTLQAQLALSGLEVVCCSSGAQALALLQDAGQRFDLLVTDQTMPGMSGIDLCTQARRLWPGLPLLLVSGSMSELVLGRLQALGRALAVAKEESAEQLLPAVQALLRARPSA